MLFNSFEFLVFFPIVTLLYFLLPQKLRWFHLLLASCIFYMYFIPVYILILFFTIAIDYVAGIMIENSVGQRRKVFLVMSIIANVGVLAFFKYINFFITNLNVLGSHLNAAASLPLLNIILPIGLSFHTFQAMSYTIEVYRGNQKAEKHPGIYALYVMFYPQLVAGPIERPQNMLHQFYEHHSFDYQNATAGLRLMMWGMFKKVVIADRLALLTNPVYNHPHNFPAATLLIATFFFCFQIYCDFSGYSDIALGAARVMGFKLMQNFNRPYFSTSIAEFWKRWHISLSTWFRDYLYISLGGNRVSVPRWYFNLFFVFLVSGFWHGANWTFIAWGALHGFYLVFAVITERFRPEVFSGFFKKHHRLNNAIQIFITFCLVLIAWVFFRANSITDACYILKQLPHAIKDMLHAILSHSLWLGRIEKYISYKDFLLSFLLIFFLEVAQYLNHTFKFENLLKARPVYVRWGFYYFAIGFILWFGVFENRQFIYFQF
jgi:alginate O-acetyltransferase complex protein AlgI